MIHIIYMSRAVRPLSDDNLRELLEQCRRDNARHNVSGVLFYSHGNIAQLIEGEAEVLEPLFEKISRDGRHSNVIRLAKRPIAARSFDGWSMAFHPLEPAAFAQFQDFFSPDEAPANPATLTIADSLLLDLLRQAVFGPEPAVDSQA
ncbi:hypothetical protein GCM10023185_03700 [Hymenobacter saemangeumensis]|uniref:BLUF domain-containing protein n=1 Tax=Hymenobacter saemangeumensis TaxID=1084522 RepID=A0ABP8HZJ7_9BACT